jgi:small-conductance mechanosensitive channel
MKYRLTILSGALVAAMALPVAAQAHDGVSPRTVAKHVRSADGALDMVESLVERNRDAKAAVQLAKLRRQSRAADREAAQLRRQSRGRRAKARAASATVAVARQHDAAAEVLAGVVDQAGGALQADIAEQINSELRGRERAISVLTRLMSRLPEQARRGLATAIARLSSDGADEVRSLSEALVSGSLSPEAVTEVREALQRATAAIDAALERLSTMAGRVPEQARPHVEQAIGRVTEQLNVVKGILAGLFSGTPTEGSGQTPGLSVPSGAQCDIPTKLPFAIPGC